MVKEKSKVEIYVEKWFKANGFEFKIIKQFVSKTKYEVSKNGITELFELPMAVTNPKSYMEMFNNCFEMKEEITKLKEVLSSEPLKRHDLAIYKDSRGNEFKVKIENVFVDDDTNITYAECSLANSTNITREIPIHLLKRIK